MGGLPDAIFVIDVGLEKIAIEEARRLKIPVIGVADTNADPAGVDYLIPGNDDAVRAIRFYCKNIADVIIDARGAADLVEAKAAAAQKKEAPEATEKTAKKVVAKKPAAKKSAAKKTAAKTPALEDTNAAVSKEATQSAPSTAADQDAADAAVSES